MKTNHNVLFRIINSFLDVFLLVQCFLFLILFSSYHYTINPEFALLVKNLILVLGFSGVCIGVLNIVIEIFGYFAGKKFYLINTFWILLRLGLTGVIAFISSTIEKFIGGFNLPL